MHSLHTQCSPHVNGVSSLSCNTLDLATSPFAAWNVRSVWRECVWVSRESSFMKLFLLCIGRFFDKNGRASSMSLSQVVADTGMSESEAKRCARKARDRWLHIEVGKGYRHAKGCANLYHAIVPPSVLAEMFDRVRRGAYQAPHGMAVGGHHRPPYTVKTDYHSEGDTPLPKRESLRDGRSDNSNVIDFASLKWGGRS